MVVVVVRLTKNMHKTKNTFRETINDWQREEFHRWVDQILRIETFMFSWRFFFKLFSIVFYFFFLFFINSLIQNLLLKVLLNIFFDLHLILCIVYDI